MGVLDAPHQTRSPEWPIGGTEERITGEGSNANPGPGAYCCASGADCEAGGCTPAYSFGGGAPRCGELPSSSAPGPGAYHVTPYADGTAIKSG